MPEPIKSDFYTKIKLHSYGIIAIFCTVLLHSIIGLRYPALFLDEFYYGSRAWAFYRLFSDPVNFQIIYDDHPPFGWLIMGLGCALMVGVPWMIRVRIFMSILFCIQQILLYGIGSKYFHRTVGIISLLINGLGSGFFIIQQMIFLDNIGIVFNLGALYLLIDREHKPNLHLLLSGLLYGIACGIKFPFIFFFPAFILFYVLSNKTESDTFFPIKYNLRMIIKWVLGVVIPIILLGIILTITGNLHYFIDGTLNQLNRTNPGATISFFLPAWYLGAPLLLLTALSLPFYFLISGIIFLIKQKRKVSLSVNKRFVDKDLRNVHFLSSFTIDGLKISLFAICFIIFLFRGGTILSHYILPLLPIMALLIGLVIYNLRGYIINIYLEVQSRKRTIDSKKKPKNIEKPITDILYMFLILIFIFPFRYPSFNTNLIKDQYSVLSWIEQNIPTNSSFIVKDFFVAELYERGYQNVQIDGFIDYESFGFDWRNIDYMILTPSPDSQFGILSEKDASFLNPAFQYAHLIYSQKIGTDKICIYIIEGYEDIK